MTDLILRAGTPEDEETLYYLITSHLQEGHLLPRELEELRRNAHRFVICEVEGDIKACFDEISHPALMDRVRRRKHSSLKERGLVKPVPVWGCSFLSAVPPFFGRAR